MFSGTPCFWLFSMKWKQINFLQSFFSSNHISYFLRSKKIITDFFKLFFSSNLDKCRWRDQRTSCWLDNFSGFIICLIIICFSTVYVSLYKVKKQQFKENLFWVLKENIFKNLTFRHWCHYLKTSSQGLFSFLIISVSSIIFRRIRI